MACIRTPHTWRIRPRAACAQANRLQPDHTRTDTFNELFVMGDNDNALPLVPEA